MLARLNNMTAVVGPSTGSCHIIRAAGNPVGFIPYIK